MNYQPQNHGKNHGPRVAATQHSSLHPPTDDKLEQQHSLFTRYKDPCRLGPGEEKPWAIGKLGAGLPMGFLRGHQNLIPDEGNVPLRSCQEAPKILVSP